MNWLQLYRIRHFLSNSIWVLPVVGMLGSRLCARLAYHVDQVIHLESRIDLDAMRTLLTTLAGSLFTLIVFVCSALLIAVQLASAQLTPRIIGLVFRDALTKLSLTLFVFFFTFTLSVLVQVKDSIPVLSAYIAAYGFLVCLAVFLMLIDHVGKVLRPSGALRTVGLLGRSVVEEVYPRLFQESNQESAASALIPTGARCSTIMNQRTGTVLAFDVQGLRTAAERYDLVIEMLPQVGDFIAAGDPVFRVYGGKEEPSRDLFYKCIAIGQERTPEQDPSFAFRIMVDIASKALSPAINDPTTAVLALDQIHHLLRHVGNRCLDDERIRDKSGRLRVVYRTPDWPNFVHLAVTEIRQFGSESIQIARRLRAMLENLIESLPPERTPLLKQELNLLKRSAPRFFVEPEDLALADVSDLQGVGGTQGSSPPRSGPGVPTSN